MIVTLCSFLLLAQALTPEVIEHTQAGVEAQKQGRLDVAIEEFRKVTELAPDMASGFASLGNAYFQKGSYELAIPALEHALQLNPELLGAHQALGVALLVRGNAVGALPHLEKARSPDLLGLAYLETGKLGDAITMLQAALGQRPNDPDLLYYFGRATALASKRAFDQIVETSPGSARAHQVAGDRYIENGQFPEAGKEYLEALRLRPYTAGVHLALAQVLAATGNMPGALAEFRAESALRPDSAEAYYRLGSALLQQGQGAAALAELTRANELGPNIPAILFALGKAALATGDLTRAETAWTKVVDIDKQGDFAAQAHMELAIMYRKAGKTIEADREMKDYEKLKGAKQ